MASSLIGQAEPDIAVRLSLAPDQVRSFLYRNHRCYYLVTDEEMRVFGFIDTRRDRQARWTNGYRAKSASAQVR